MRAIRFIPLVLCCSLIFYMSSQPAIQVTTDAVGDFSVHKLAHIIEYATLYATFILAFYKNRDSYMQLSILGLVFVLMYGVSDEIHQMFTPTRSPKLFDVFVDFIGGVVGYALISVIVFNVIEKQR